MEKYKILVVDDDDEIRLALVSLLENENYEVNAASDGQAALEMLATTGKYDLIILDVMMPFKDGIATCIDIREEYIIPILFLTAKNTEYDKYIGFSVGGDDYLEKPFSKMELLARVSALIRRFRRYQNKLEKKEQEVTEFIYLKDLKICTHTSRVFKQDDEVLLTNTEYKILMLLINHPNKIFTLENIYESVWEEEYNYSFNPSIMVHIKNIRKKLGDTSKGSIYIKNIWGRGYCVEK